MCCKFLALDFFKANSSVRTDIFPRTAHPMNLFKNWSKMAAEAIDLADHDPMLAKLSKEDNPYSFKKFVSKNSSDDVNVDLRVGKKKKKTKKVSTDLPFPDLTDEDSTTKAPKSGDVLCSA